MGGIAQSKSGVGRVIISPPDADNGDKRTIQIIFQIPNSEYQEMKEDFERELNMVEEYIDDTVDASFAPVLRDMGWEHYTIS